MAARDTGCDRPRPVQHLRPGDHAFVSYGDDEVRWEVVTAFVRLGPARGEKVLVLPSPGVPEGEVLARIDFPSRSTVRARERGQLVVSSMREVMLAAMQRAHPCIEVHCDRGQRWLLRRLGAGTVSRPALTEVVRAW
ncbi:hypothetical protein CP981_05805 [Streptomyces platensis]|uniref:Uncharacterized protein n=1 Tax=Streptomyces platensis TaxID=58346 RepID=A0AAE6NE61_STRPT|nr:hypothetical protein [Streptomyces platensis]OSY46506.1 hypothetical protein BG653_02178 [Streptomyces platensis]QEV51249.1 hypothetical protein CP981_05805 [Streptomyces platensis]